MRLGTRTIPEKWHAEIEKQTEEMLAKGVIEPSTSPYRFYPVMAKKKDGSWRFAIDFRKLNAITVPDSYPMPRMEDLFHAIKGSKYFSLLDLSSGFSQIPLNPQQRHFTAFSTHKGHFQFKVMPMGIINGSATFQHWMDIVLGDMRHKGVLVYIDDILIHHETEKGMLLLVEIVLKRLNDNGAKIKLTKCQVNPKEFEYLGHKIDGELRKPSTREIMRFKTIKWPTTAKEVRSVLSALNYYRVYIPHLADMIRPLMVMTRKNAVIKWTQEHQDIVVKAIDMLETAVLQCALTGCRFRLETDASDTGIGGVLYDKDKYDEDPAHALPIMFMSRRLTDTKCKWSVNEREMWAMVWCLEHCQAMLQ